MGLGELTVERFEGVADDQRILLLRGPISIDTAPQFERAVRLERAETMILDLVGCAVHRFGWDWGRW